MHFLIVKYQDLDIYIDISGSRYLNLLFHLNFWLEKGLVRQPLALDLQVCVHGNFNGKY